MPDSACITILNDLMRQWLNSMMIYQSGSQYDKFQELRTLYTEANEIRLRMDDRRCQEFVERNKYNSFQLADEPDARILAPSVTTTPQTLLKSNIATPEAILHDDDTPRQPQFETTLQAIEVEATTSPPPPIKLADEQIKKSSKPSHKPKRKKGRVLKKVKDADTQKKKEKAKNSMEPKQRPRIIDVDDLADIRELSQIRENYRSYEPEYYGDYVQDYYSSYGDYMPFYDRRPWRGGRQRRGRPRRPGPRQSFPPPLDKPSRSTPHAPIDAPIKGTSIDQITQDITKDIAKDLPAAIADKFTTDAPVNNLIDENVPIKFYDEAEPPSEPVDFADATSKENSASTNSSISDAPRNVAALPAYGTDKIDAESNKTLFTNEPGNAIVDKLINPAVQVLVKNDTLNHTFVQAQEDGMINSTSGQFKVVSTIKGNQIGTESFPIMNMQINEDTNIALNKRQPKNSLHELSEKQPTNKNTKEDTTNIKLSDELVDTSNLSQQTSSLNVTSKGNAESQSNDSHVLTVSKEETNIVLNTTPMNDDITNFLMQNSYLATKLNNVLSDEPPVPNNGPLEDTSLPLNGSSPSKNNSLPLKTPKSTKDDVLKSIYTSIDEDMKDLIVKDDEKTNKFRYSSAEVSEDSIINDVLTGMDPEEQKSVLELLGKPKSFMVSSGRLDSSTGSVLHDEDPMGKNITYDRTQKQLSSRTHISSNDQSEILQAVKPSDSPKLSSVSSEVPLNIITQSDTSPLPENTQRSNVIFQSNEKGPPQTLITNFATEANSYPMESPPILQNNQSEILINSPPNDITSSDSSNKGSPLLQNTDKINYVENNQAENLAPSHVSLPATFTANNQLSNQSNLTHMRFRPGFPAHDRSTNVIMQFDSSSKVLTESDTPPQNVIKQSDVPYIKVGPVLPADSFRNGLKESDLLPQNIHDVNTNHPQNDQTESLIRQSESARIGFPPIFPANEQPENVIQSDSAPIQIPPFLPINAEPENVMIQSDSSGGKGLSKSHQTPQSDQMEKLIHQSESARIGFPPIFPANDQPENKIQSDSAHIQIPPFFPLNEPNNMVIQSDSSGSKRLSKTYQIPQSDQRVNLIHQPESARIGFPPIFPANDQPEHEIQSDSAPIQIRPILPVNDEPENAIIQSDSSGKGLPISHEPPRSDHKSNNQGQGNNTNASALEDGLSRHGFQEFTRRVLVPQRSSYDSKENVIFASPGHINYLPVHLYGIPKPNTMLKVSFVRDQHIINQYRKKPFLDQRPSIREYYKHYPTRPPLYKPSNRWVLPNPDVNRNPLPWNKQMMYNSHQDIRNPNVGPMWREVPSLKPYPDDGTLIYRDEERLREPASIRFDDKLDHFNPTLPFHQIRKPHYYLDNLCIADPKLDIRIDPYLSSATFEQLRTQMKATPVRYEDEWNGLNPMLPLCHLLRPNYYPDYLCIESPYFDSGRLVRPYSPGAFEELRKQQYPLWRA